jgi:hypothetical protein
VHQGTRLIQENGSKSYAKFGWQNADASLLPTIFP